MLVPRATSPPILPGSFILLGVRFHHLARPKGTMGPLAAGLARVTEVIEAGSEQARRRQKRGAIQYIDALTALDRIIPTPPERRSAEENLLRELVPGLAAQSLTSATLTSLWQLPPLALIRSSVEQLHPALHDASLGRNKGRGHNRGGSAGTGREVFDAARGLRGRFTAPGDGLFRILDLDLEEVAGEEAADWPRLLSLAVLAQLRADLEVWLETGFLRVRKCQLVRCGSWFIARRMAGRQRFCSPYCRVASSREP